jgi:hypothetical protein
LSSGAIRATSADVGSAHTALAPFRLVDTRAGSGYHGTGNPLSPNSTFGASVTDVDVVPTSATAVALNVTVTDASSASYLVVYPSGEPRLWPQTRIGRLAKQFRTWSLSRSGQVAK